MSCIYGRYKKLILSINCFNKEIEFAMYSLCYRSPLVLHHVCLQPQSYYTFLAFTAS